MNNKNISKKIRMYAIKKCNLIDDLFGNVSDIEQAKLLFESLNNIENNKNVHILCGYGEPTISNIESIKPISVLLRVQMYTDYYRIAKLQDKLYNTSLLMTIPRIKSYEELKDFSQEGIIQYGMLESLKEYHESPGYDKVLYAKCLNKKDVKFLKTINPFFEEEYNRCNTIIDLSFVEKHIEKWQDQYPMDHKLSYLATARFIFDLYKINKEEAVKLLIDLFNEDLGIINSTKKNDEYIKIGEIIINIDNLSRMFEEYYEYKQNTLKKRR